MKKLLIWAMMLTSIICVSCTESEEGDEDKLGSIYGIVTELGTAEPMKAVGVELYKAGALLLKTVTFDDGHFEFKDLNPENYQVKVVADGYDQTEDGYVTVEAGRQARIDLQVKAVETGMVIKTTGAAVNEGVVTLNGEYKYSETSPNEIGFLYATHNNPKNGGTIVKCKDKDIIKGYNLNGTFTATINDLDEETYYFQAYAINSKGIAYGEVRSFAVTLPDYITLDNLMIQRNDFGPLTWPDADQICKASSVAGYTDWRMPTINELKIIYYNRNKIPNLKSDCYWSSDIISGCYSYVSFYSGNDMTSSPREFKRYYVRAVRTIN